MLLVVAVAGAEEQTVAVSGNWKALKAGTGTGTETETETENIAINTDQVRNFRVRDSLPFTSMRYALVLVPVHGSESRTRKLRSV